MNQQDKELLLKDLSTRLPYGVIIERPELFYPQRKVTEKLVTINDLWRFNDDGIYIEYIKPYLRPLSSMTEEESKEFGLLQTDFYTDGFLYPIAALNLIDWLNAHHFDYRGLIERGLALEAPEDMYNIKKK